MAFFIDQLFILFEGSHIIHDSPDIILIRNFFLVSRHVFTSFEGFIEQRPCLLYTSDAADDLLCVDLGGRRIIKKKKTKTRYKDQ